MAEGTDLTNDEEVKKNDVVNSDDPEQIREQIEETRNEMSETIDALQEKLSVENITEQVSEKASEKASELYEAAKDTVYQATVVKAGNFMKNIGREVEKTGILRTAGENPIPLILIGLGAGLLFFNNRKENDRTSYDVNRRRLSGGKGDSSIVRKARNKIGDTTDSAYDTAGSAYDAAAGAAGSAYDAAADAAESAYDAAGNAYDAAGNYVGDALDTVGNLGSQARESYDYYLNENPLAVGAVALALGAVVGLAIPTTSYENELMGEAREKLVSKAQNAAQETVEKVKNVAGETIGTVKDDVAEKAKAVVGNAADTVDKEAKNQGLK